MDVSDWAAAFEGKNVQQIVSFCGNGKLTNGSDCSKEFCEFLEEQNEAKLAEHANYCLENSFEKSGYVLQDVVNEIGRRIGYDVENGLYSGKKGAVGFDGIWKNGNEWTVVEVKTTDAYRINLDTVMEYARKLEKTIEDEVKLSALIVVGRQDTGDLEAQIRGSKHAWSIRLVSADALMKLMFLNSELDDENFGYKANRILRPFEYTRVDDIVDLIFETQKETEKTITGEGEDFDEESDVEKRKFEFTPVANIDEKRQEIARRFFENLGVEYRKISRTNFVSEDGKIGICCSISKRYKRDYQPYWYALHLKWIDFMKQHEKGYFILGCMDRNEAFCIPFNVVSENIENLNTTKKDDKQYWHIVLIIDDGKIKWNISKIGKKIDLAAYTLNTYSQS